jgi:magnesium chelatase family protein
MLETLNENHQLPTSPEVSRVHSLVKLGLESQALTIEALKVRGLSQLILMGSADATLQESKDKIRSLIARESKWGPLDRILVHMLPTSMPKSGTHLELPLALACLASLQPALSDESKERLNQHVFGAGLSLGGLLCATPESDILERSNENFIGARHFESLSEIWKWVITGKRVERPLLPLGETGQNSSFKSDYVPSRWVQLLLRLAAKDRLSMAFCGAPGSGKSQSARWASILLPVPDTQTHCDIDATWAQAGLKLKSCPPTVVAQGRQGLAELIGTLSGPRPQPGLCALAHGGLLILEEFPEFSRDCREVLRTLIDEREIVRCHRRGTIKWKTDFWLIATMNPCPCGFARPNDLGRCQCGHRERAAYRRRISGPIRDRLALVVDPSINEDTHPTCRRWVEFLDENNQHSKDSLAQARSPQAPSPQARSRQERFDTILAKAAQDIFSLSFDDSINLITDIRKVEALGDLHNESLSTL